MGSGLSQWSKGLAGAINDALDVVGEHIRSEEDNTAKGTYGESLKAIDTGNMSISYNYDRPNKTTVRNGNPVDYTIYIEFGTQKMRARPIMRQTIETNDDEITEIVSRAINAI